MKAVSRRKRRGGKTLSYLLPLAITLGAAASVHAATSQKFIWVGSASAQSEWTTSSCWMYWNGSKWKTTASNPGEFSYDTYIRAGVTYNGTTYGFDPDWNKVVTFSGERSIGIPQDQTSQPLHIDAGSSAESPIVFAATDPNFGLSSSSHLYLGETADGYLQIDSGTYSFGTISVGAGSGYKGVLTLNGGTLRTTDKYTRLGHENTLGTLTVKAGAVFDNSAAGNKNFTLGEQSGSSGTLNVQGGDVMVAGQLFMCFNESSVDAAVNVTEGGTLTVGQIVRWHATTGTGTLTIDDGTIKAAGKLNPWLMAQNDLTVTVGAGGATFDANGRAVTLEPSIGGTGGVRFKGGSTVTLAGANTYAGGTTVELGTMLVATNATTLATILSDLVIDGRTTLQARDYDVVEANGLLSADTDLSHITLVNCDSRSTVHLDDAENPTKIVVTLVEPPCVNTSGSILVFPGQTLTTLRYANFDARFCGTSVSAAARALGSAKGYNTRFVEENGALTGIIGEFQILDNDAVKCVVVKFTDGTGGVEAIALGARYIYTSNGGFLGYSFYNADGTFASAPKEQAVAASNDQHGYGACDFRWEPDGATEWTLGEDRTWSQLRGGTALAADAVVRIKVTGHEPTLTLDEDVSVAKVIFVNEVASGSSTCSLVHSGNPTVSIGEVEIGLEVVLRCASGRATTLPTVSGSGSIVVAPGGTLELTGDVVCGYILNNGTVVKNVFGTILVPIHDSSRGVWQVNAGVLKASLHVDGEKPGIITEGNPAANQIVDVAAGATFDVNGVQTSAAVRLAEGASFINTGAEIGYNRSQVVQIILTGNANVTAASTFGLVGKRYSETQIDLGSRTLTLSGDGAFYLETATITGNGTLAVNSGNLYAAYGKASTGRDCTVIVDADGTLTVNADLTVGNFVNGGTVDSASTNTLTVCGTLTPGASAIPRLTLVDGATITVTGTAQAVASEFVALGTVQIDVSNITKAQLKTSDAGLGVLTVPAAFAPVPSDWVLTGTLEKIRTSWVGNEAGTTKTLRIFPPIGLSLTIR